MKYKKALLVSIIIFSLFSSLFSINVLGISDINYTFDDDKLFDDTIDSYEAPYNLKYQQEYTGLYNATYSFTNDSNAIYNTSAKAILGINFLDTETTIQGNVEISILNSFQGHSKVLKLEGNNIADEFIFTVNTFNPQIQGIVEFWILLGQTDEGVRFYLKGDISSVNLLHWDQSGNVLYRDDTGEHDTGENYLQDIWYHYKIEFNVSDDWHLWINQISIDIGVGYSFFQVQNNFFELRVLNYRFTNDDSISYWDGFGYSWGISQEVFDFSDDVVGNEPIGWNSDNDIDTNSTIYASLDNREKILGLFDDSNGVANISTTFNNGVIENIQFDYTKSTISFNAGDGIILFYENENEIISLLNRENNLIYIDGGGAHTIKNNFLLADTFVVVLLILNHSSNTFDIYLDGVLEGSNLNYRNNIITEINRIELLTMDFHFLSYTMYIDNILLDINFYNISTNLIPYINTSQSLQEVDKYEFALNDIHTFNAGGTSNPNGWNSIESGGGVSIIFPEFDSSYDRLVLIQGSSIADVGGLEKDNFIISGNFIDVSLGVFFTIMDGGVNDNFTFLINSSDNSVILSFSIKADLSVWYNDGGVDKNTNRDIVLGNNNRYNFNFLLNYELDLIFFTYSLNNLIQEIFIFEMITLNKEGLKKINYQTVLNTNNDMKSYIDYIGIYNNGISQVDKGVDFGIALIPINNAWNFEVHNLFTFIAKGTFHLAGSPTGYFEGFPFDVIQNTTVYNDFTQDFINIHDKFVGNLADAKLVITVLGNNFNFSYLKISGVVLTEGSNSYNLIFEYSEVDIQESFFYTDTNNKLQFTHISDDINSSEFIQAKFNINDSTSTEARISFRSLINNNAKGFFRVNYTTTSDFIPFPSVQSTTSIFLTQGNTIRDFLIIITDLDDNSVSGLTSGFIDNVKLLFLENVQITVITLSLLGMIIPLIIILTPTVALRDLYDESFVIPIFLLMSLILVIGGILPIWLFFIIAISSSLFLLKENIQKDD